MTLFLPQNSNPLQITLIKKSRGPLSMAPANVHSGSQSKKLSTVICSLSVLRFMTKSSICVSGTSRSDLRRLCGKSGIFLQQQSAHTNSVTGDALRCVRPAQLLMAFLDRGCSLVAWSLNSSMGQVFLLASFSARIETSSMAHSNFTLPLKTHALIQQTLSCTTNSVLFPYLFSTNECSSSNTTLWPRIVSRLTDAGGNQLVAA